jgi:hypothetical protein
VRSRRITRDEEPAHGIDVAQRVRGRDLSEVVGVVDDRREEVGGEDERASLVDAIEGGVIGCLAPTSTLGSTTLGRQQERKERSRWMLRRASGSLDRSTACSSPLDERRVAR